MGWPMGKLLRNLAELPAEERQRQLVVLVTTGALNPVHAGHVGAMEAARRRVEESGDARVLCGWLSPSHQLYVGPKMASLGDWALPAATRVRCVRLAVQGSPWLEAASWESSSRHSRWPDFPEVVAALDRALRGLDIEEWVRERLQVRYVCGSDHLRVVSSSFRYPVVVVCRQGLSLSSFQRHPAGLQIVDSVEWSTVESTPEKEDKEGKEGKEGKEVGLEIELASLSSTKVRALLKKGLVPEHMLPTAGVAECLAGVAPRWCFVCPSSLAEWCQLLPGPLLDSCLLFLACSPGDVFSRSPPCPEPFLAFLSRKRSLGHLYFLFPDLNPDRSAAHSPSSISTSLSDASTWLQSLTDPFSGLPYLPLLLNASYWQSFLSPPSRALSSTPWDSSSARIPPASAFQVLSLLSGSLSDPAAALLILLTHSNPSLLVALSPADIHSSPSPSPKDPHC